MQPGAQGGDMVIAGAFTTIHDANKANFAHLFADGSVDQNFTDASDIPIFAMALQPDGKFILAGENLVDAAEKVVTAVKEAH